MTIGVIDFKDISQSPLFDVVPEQALAWFKAKGLRVSFAWQDLYGEEHDKAFTVAKMMDIDLLKEVHQQVTDAIETGSTFDEFTKSLIPKLQAAGWWGERVVIDPLTGNPVTSQLGSVRRLETIFRTNMMSAYAAGSWRQIMDQAEDAPYLLYDAIDDGRTRAEHRAWNNTVLPASDKFWNTHYPPNGYNCRCSVIQLDDGDLERLSLKVTKPAPKVMRREWENPRTGKVEMVPIGIDPGFEHNVGKGYQDELEQLLDEKIQSLPTAELRRAAAKNTDPLFDESTVAGKWSATAFAGGQDWVLRAASMVQNVEVEIGSGAGAWARRGDLVHMGEKLRRGMPEADGIWRHEFGHIMDYRVARKQNSYRSGEGSFPSAVNSDAAAAIKAAGKGRKSKKLDAFNLQRSAAYASAQDRIVDADRGDRESVLRAIAKENGVDFDRFMRIVRDSTLVLDGESIQLAQAARIAKMMVAVGRGDAEEFVRLGLFLDNQNPADAMDMFRLRKRTGEKDPAIAMLSDLTGASTRNQAANFAEGFPGHSKNYYSKGPHYSLTEVFANLTALAGHKNPYWWELVRRFFPKSSAEYQEIITEAGRP